MRTAIAAVLLFVASNAVAQPESFSITEVAPAVGSVGGGDVVNIYVDRFPQRCDPAACTAIARVLFGDVPARSFTVDHNLIRAITPAHVSGTVDVSVVVGSPVVATNAYTFIDWNQLASLSVANYERILVPVSMGPGETIPGAYGSQWQSEFWVHNAGPNNVEFFNGFPWCPIGGSPFGCTGLPFPYVKGGGATQYAPGDTLHAGYMFYAQRGGADDLTFSLRTRDVSRTTENSGTELPVSHEREFRNGALEILNVPFDAWSRTSLRIYAVDGGSPVAIVNVYAMSGGSPLATFDVPLASPPDYASASGFFSRTGYAFVGDIRTAALPTIIAGPPVPFADGKYRIEVTSRTAWPKWAMVSVTNNSTQLVTAIGPQ